MKSPIDKQTRKKDGLLGTIAAALVTLAVAAANNFGVDLPEQVTNGIYYILVFVLTLATSSIKWLKLFR